MRVKHHYAVTEIDADFQAVITAARAQRGMTRTAFAKLIGVSRQSLIAYEEQGQAPKLMLAASIAQRLEITLDELAGIAPLPDRSLDLVDLAQELRDVATVQSGLVSGLQAAALRLARLGGQGDLTGTG